MDWTKYNVLNTPQEKFLVDWSGLKVETKAALTGVLIQQLNIPHWPIFYLAKTQDTWCSIENTVRK